MKSISSSFKPMFHLCEKELPLRSVSPSKRVTELLTFPMVCTLLDASGVHRFSAGFLQIRNLSSLYFDDHNTEKKSNRSGRKVLVKLR